MRSRAQKARGNENKNRAVLRIELLTTQKERGASLVAPFCEVQRLCGTRNCACDLGTQLQELSNPLERMRGPLLLCYIFFLSL